MSMSSVLLVVLAAFIHALWNLLAKRAADVGPPFVFAYTAVGAVLYLPWVCWILLRDVSVQASHLDAARLSATTPLPELL